MNNKSNRVRTIDAFSLTACVLVFESSFKWHTFLFLMLFCSDSAHFSEIQLVCDRPTDGPTDGRTDRPTDGRTDIPSYRDARTHLKTQSTSNRLRARLCSLTFRLETKTHRRFILIMYIYNKYCYTFPWLTQQRARCLIFYGCTFFFLVTIRFFS